MKKILLLLTAIMLSNLTYSEKVKHSSYQKPGAAIMLKSPEQLHIPAHSQHTISIILSTPKYGQLSLRTKVSDGIQIEGLPPLWTGDLSQQTLSFDVHIQSGEGGRYQIMFYAQLIQDEHQSSRVFGLPILVGEQPEQKNKRSPKYIRLPAQEKVSPAP